MDYANMTVEQLFELRKKINDEARARSSEIRQTQEKAASIIKNMLEEKTNTVHEVIEAVAEATGITYNPTNIYQRKAKLAEQGFDVGLVRGKTTRVLSPATIVKWFETKGNVDKLTEEECQAIEEALQ